MKENLYLNLTGISIGLIFVSFLYYCFLNGFRIFVITSGSMEPAIKSGSLIITQPQARYHQGQVITYYAEKSPNSASQEDLADKASVNNNFVLVTHRIVSSLIVNGQRNYITQGDANTYPDKISVGQNHVVGRVWLVIPFVGRFLSWIYSKIGFYFLVLLPVSWIIVTQIKNIISLLIHEKS
jgi:signal peptidase I